MKSENDTIRYYDEHACEFIESSINADMTVLYDKFIRYLPVEGNVLDVGCGSGRDSLFFKKCGYNVTAVDASIEMCQRATVLIGQSVQQMKFEDISFENHYDGVWACASLLHVDKTSIKDILERLVKSLVPNGVLYASWKYGIGERVDGNRFYCDYNEKNIRQLVDGIKQTQLLEIWISKDTRSADYNTKWINLLLKRIE